MNTPGQTLGDISFNKINHPQHFAVDRDAKSIALALGGKPNGDGWIAACPAHEDHNPSFKISEGDDGKTLFYCFAGCSQEAVMDALKDRGLWGAGQGGGGFVYPKTTVQPCNLENYAAKKGLPVEFLKELGLTDITYESSPAVKIPYRDSNNEEVTANFRRHLEKGTGGDVRFKWKAGSKKLLYGLWRLKQSNYVVLVEGESDCHTLWYKDIPAIGLPGAGCWKDDRDSGPLDGIGTIYVIIEPDQGGESVKKWLAKSSIKDRVKLVSLPNKDPSGLYLSDPESFVENFNQALEQAQPYLEYERRELEAEHREAWEQCQELASERNILDCFLQDFRRSGVVGEDRTGKLIFLALTSRFLSRPVSIAIKGPSSGGKSYCIEQVLRFFPGDAYHALTAMSDKNLVYSEEPLEHRFLIIYEASGMEGDMASYLIRSLLSEGRLAYEMVEKTPEGLRSRRIEKEGPTGLIVTTTKVKLHPENETRLFSILVKDTQEQTKAVLIALAEDSQKEICLNKWQALQTWLKGAAHDVTIPYAKSLAENIPPIAVRLRRDFTAILHLIKAHALLHQSTRKRDQQGRIIAEIEDYRVIRELVSDLVSEGVEATVPKTVRETVEKVDSLIIGDSPVTVAQVAKKLELDKSAALRRVRSAIEKGHLKNMESKPGRPYRLVMGDPLPEDMQILPDPEGLQGCTVDLGDKAPPIPLERIKVAI